MLAIALANYAGAESYGHSMAFDGIAFTEDGVSRDMCVIEAGEAEGVYLAEFDFDALRAYRQREVWGNQVRRPGSYKLLTAV